MHIFTVAQCSTSVDANLDSVDELWREVTELLLTELIPTIYQAMCSAEAHCGTADLAPPARAGHSAPYTLYGTLCKAAQPIMSRS